MNLSDTAGLDPNQIPYFVIDGAGNPVPVLFAPLTEADTGELAGEDWAGAAFRDAWIQWAESGVSRALKLVPARTQTPLLGIVNAGRVAEGGLFLAKSLLESSPVHRHGQQMTSAAFRGIGRVLVARLVIESYNQDAGGAVVVTSREEAKGFYERIGFVPIRNRPLGYRLTREAAALLFEKATL